MSAPQSILALSTYGTQTKTHQGGRVSALKIGSIGPVARIVLDLLSDAADISSKRDRYVYIHLPNKPKLRHNWLFVHVSAHELQRVETILHEQKSHGGVVLWRAGQWQRLSDEDQPHYQPAHRSEAPQGSPIGYWAINSAGEIGPIGGSPAPDQLIAQYSKSDPEKAAWWWLPGNDATYEQRFRLKQLGCRWVRKRHAYAYIGDRLPEDLLALLDNADACRAIMKGMAADDMQQTQRLSEGQTDQGTGSSEDDAMRASDPNLASDKEGELNSTVDMIPVMDIPTSEWHPSLVEVPPRALVQPATDPAGCPCETNGGPKGWYRVEHLDTWVACSSCNPTGTHRFEGDPNRPEVEGPPLVRLIKAVALPTDETNDDTIQRAIRHATPQAPKPATPPLGANTGLKTVPMDYVGELTGSVVANVHCYGYASDAGELIYLNMGGPRSGIEAIRAKLSKGEMVNLIPEDAPTIELTAGAGNLRLYSAIMSNISEARFTHCILVHEKLTEPNYNGAGRTYILEVNAAQAKGQLLHHIRETVSLPIFDDWLDYLWQAGQTAMLVRSCRSGGGLTVKAVDLDPSSWQRLITGGIGQGVIAIPRTP